MGKLKNIAILAGGDSSEYGISIKSAQVVEKNLRSNFQTYLVLMKGGRWVHPTDEIEIPIDKNNFSLTLNGKKIKFDAVFIAIHGSPGEDGKLQGYFDMLGIPYSSSNVLSSSLSFNKGVCNDYLRNHGIPVAKSVQLYNDVEFSVEELIQEIGLPCFVKPNQAGSSYGVSKVKSKTKLPDAIKHAFEHDNQVLIESLLEGREVTCGAHNFDGTIQAMPITEIITEHEFFDFSAKYEGESQEITPADIDVKTRFQVEETTKKVYQLLGLNGVARVDYILHNGIPHVIEANTVPGLSAESLIPQQAEAMGYTLPDFFQKWIESTCG